MPNFINRIILNPVEHHKIEILDIHDKKKLGSIRIGKKNKRISIKSQYAKTNMLIETAFLLSQNPDDNWEQYWMDHIGHINKCFDLKMKYNYPAYTEAIRLKYFGQDIFDRKVMLHPVAGKQWKKMKNAAKKDQIALKIISAFRSIDYQKQLIINKLNKGIKLNNILTINTLPGYSEHHSGLAIDIGCDNSPVLEQDFDKSDAYKWLSRNANSFGFYLSYPENNTHGIIYEPWHWCYKPYA